MKCECGHEFEPEIKYRHRLLCGDATDEDDVERLMDGEQAELTVTDPPYGVDRGEGFGGAEPFNGEGEEIKRKEYKGGWDNEIPDQSFYENLEKYSGDIMIFGGNYFAHFLPQSKHWIVWDKKNTMPTFGDAELIWTNVERKSVVIYEYEYNGLINQEDEERKHATQKPVKLISEMLKDYSENENLILDSFLGSGSTLIAAEQMDRRCYGMEIDPQYVDVCVERWENLTGETAERIPANE